jgi:hypothetical protein
MSKFYEYKQTVPFDPDTNPFCVYSVEYLGDDCHHVSRYRMCGIHPSLQVGDIVDHDNDQYEVVELERRAPAGALRHDERFKEAYFTAILKR